MAGKFQIAITIASVIVPWCFPDISFQWKIIIALSALLISCIMYCQRLSEEILRLNKVCSETTDKHKALAKRFDERKVTIQRYAASFDSIEYLIDATIQTSRQDRLVILYDGFLKIKGSLAPNDKEGD